MSLRIYPKMCVLSTGYGISRWKELWLLNTFILPDAVKAWMNGEKLRWVSNRRLEE
jgi:hypothetical protein